jgi:hypothetical protein
LPAVEWPLGMVAKLIRASRMAIERPTKLYDFGSVQVAPAYEIDRQFDNHRRSIDAIIKLVSKIIRADGKLNNDLLTPESFPKDILGKIQSAALSDALRAHEATTAMLKEITARQKAIELSTKELRALIQKNASDNQTTRSLGVEVQARSVALSTTAMSAQVQARDMLDDSFNTQNEVLRQAAVAEDWANVSIAWAEHMPDTIPPNILATNAVTGEHWSSRWWAMKSTAMFGMMAMLYCGASDVPPIQTLTGDPLTPGCIYFDTNTNTMQVWNGSAWQPFTVPQKAFTSSLYYLASNGQQAFPLTATDLYDHTFTLNQADTEGIEVYVNGARLTPDTSSSLSTGDYFVEVASSTIMLAQTLPAGAMVAIDVLQTASQLAPGAVAIHPMVNINTPLGFQDGSRTTFVLTVKSDGTNPNLAGPEELLISVDGVLQEAAVQYQASGDSVTFLQAPTADAYVFISWFKTPLNNTPLGAMV